MHHGRDQCSEAVVVAKTDLVSCDTVVLVDDRHNSQLEQSVERALGVPVVRAAHHVVCGEQHLPNREAVARESRGVSRDEHSLAHARRGLLHRELAGPCGQPKRPNTSGDRTRRDQHRVSSLEAGQRNGVGYGREASLIEVAVGAGERGGANLDDDAMRVRNHIAALAHSSSSA